MRLDFSEKTRRGGVNQTRQHAFAEERRYDDPSCQEIPMKMTKSLLVAAVAAAALAATAADAARGGGGGGGGGGRGSGGGGWSGGGHGGGHGGYRGASTGGGRHWSHGGGHYGGGHHGGHGHSYWYGGYYWPYYAWAAAPLWYGSYYWGSPYWDGYYPSGPVAYREPYPMSVAPNEFEVSSTEVQRAPGAPTQAPAYRNYCESAKAYYPKVTTCPEGWRFEPAR
jgi:hypothetical protein